MLVLHIHARTIDQLGEQMRLCDIYRRVTALVFTVPQRMYVVISVERYHTNHVQNTKALLQRHNECNGLLNHRHLDGLLKCLFRSKKTSKLHVTGLFGGNPPVTGGFPSQRASNVENVSISWRHHGDDAIFTLLYNNIGLSVINLWRLATQTSDSELGHRCFF